MSPASAAIHTFRIANLTVCISFAASDKNSMELLPQLAPFATAGSDDTPLLHLHVDDALRPLPKAECHFIRKIDEGNGIFTIWHRHTGGYQFIIASPEGYDCCLLQTNADFSDCQCALNGPTTVRQFGLNNALMLCYGFAACFYDALLIHASTVRCEGKAYPFIARSGTGKSTHVALWLQNIPGCDLMNDDNPVVRIINGIPYLFGSPWSGKTPCYRQTFAPLGAITRIVRDGTNFAVRKEPLDGFASFLPSCTAMKWDHDIYHRIIDTVGRVSQLVPIFDIHCTPTPEAAIVCHQALCKK